MIYVIATLVCVLFDTISFFRQISFFKADDSLTSFGDVALLFIAVFYLGLNYFYVAWLLGQKFKFPDSMTKILLFGLVGSLKQASEVVTQKLDAVSDPSKRAASQASSQAKKAPAK